MKKPKLLNALIVSLKSNSSAKEAKVFSADIKTVMNGKQVYVGNTVKIDIPREDGLELIEVNHLSSDKNIVKVKNNIVIGLKMGEAVITSQVTSKKVDEKTLVHMEYETPITVSLGRFKLKTTEATKYLLQKQPVLLDRTSTILSVGKTARIVPALSYGVFSKVSYQSSNEKIATVTNHGLIGLVRGHASGNVTITATADIGGDQLEQSITVRVMKTTVPVKNPQNACNYSKEDDWSGDRVYFGSYEQDNKLSNGPEPICWRVLEVADDSILLLSEYGLESKNIHDSFEPMTWETCTLRKWLNANFLNKAFTLHEQSAIIENKIITKDNIEWGTKGGNDTRDKVFLLSVEEATNPLYGFFHDFSQASPTRVVKNTAYATIHDGYTNKKNGNTCWWLRTPGVDGPFAAYFFTNGSGTYSYFVGRRNDAVRPAIRLRLSDISFGVDKSGKQYPYIIVNDTE